MGDQLLKLPWQIQVALASGYTAYLLAYMGIRESHKPVDTTFKTLIFGLAASAVLWWFRALHPVLAGALAFSAALAAGLIWRIVGLPALRWTARKLDFSWSNDDPSAWASITAHNSGYYITEISVLTDDGRELLCTPAADFSEDSCGPVTFGPSGDVALYVSQVIAADGTVEVVDSVRHADLGPRLTYIPNHRVRSVSMRHRHKSSYATTRRRWWRWWRRG